MVDAAVSPDDVCLVCDTKRDDHGDRQHKFSLEGQLIPLDPPPKPREKAPLTREEAEALATANKGVEEAGPNIKLAFATLVEILADKQVSFDGVGRPLLTNKDIIRIFSGQG